MGLAKTENSLIYLYNYNEQFIQYIFNIQLSSFQQFKNTEFNVDTEQLSQVSITISSISITITSSVPAVDYLADQ